MEICFTTLPTTYVEDNSAPKRARPAFFHLLLILVSPFSPTSMGRLYGKVTRFGITICCCRTLHLGGGAEEVGRKRRKKVTSRISTRGWGSTSMELVV